MVKSSIEQLKESVAAIRENQVRLKAQASAICATIDDDDLVPSDQAEDLRQALENDQQLKRQLYEAGNQLSLSLGTKLSEISVAIQEYENAYNFDRLRAVVLDYLRLNAHSEEHRDTLKRTKQLLCSICTLPDDHIEIKLEPYERVVSAVKRKDTLLPREIFQLITDKIDFNVACATIRGELSYDAACDVSEYMDGSSPLLTGDPGTTESAPATPVPEIQVPGQEPEAEPPPSGTETDIVTEPARRWPSYGGYVSEALTVNCTDRSEQPTLDDIISLEKQNHDTVLTLWNSANEKLIPFENDDPGSRILSPEAVRQLYDTGLLTDLTITDKSHKKNYLMLSSKGWACFSRSDIAGYLAKKRMPLIIPDKLRISNQAWTPLLAARAALIHDYCRKRDKNYVMWKSDSCEMLVAKTAEQESVTLLAGLFQESLEEDDLRELVATLDTLGDAADVLVLVRQHDDITVLTSEIKAMSAQAAKAVLFAVEDENFAVYCPTDPSGKPPRDDPDDKSATTSDLPESQVIAPEASAPIDSTLLTALNSIKSGPVSASKFKNDIAEYAKRHKAIYAILPLLTNLGVLEREQVIRFGICLGCFADDKDASEQVRGALDFLSDKGLLAHYQYLHDRKTIDAYGMARYCYGSMKKQEVSSLPGWSLSIGNRSLICDRSAAKDEIERTVKANADLLEYVRAAKSQYDQSEYAVVQKSIKWLDGCYIVDCFWESVKYHCCLFAADLDPQSASRDNLILIHNHEQDMNLLSGSFKRIFVVDNGKINLSTCNDDREQTESPPCAASATGDGDSKPKGADNPPVTETVEKQPEEPGKSIGIPTDEAFCKGVQAILNAPSKSEQELITSVANALLLARTAGFIKGYEKTRSLSQRLQLATSIFFDGCSYCSSDLAANFTDAGLDQQAITLAACCFAMLTPAVSYDYALHAQIKSYFDNYETCFPGFSGLKNLFSKLLTIQTISQTGFSPSVIALLGSDDESKTFSKNLRAQARGYLTNVVTKAKLRTLPIMYGACFGSGSDLFACMNIVAENKDDDLDFVKTVLAEYCTERNSTLTIEISKIEDKLDREWELANPKNKFKLEYDARVLAIKQFRLRLELLLTWLEHLSAKKTKNDSLEKLHRLRHAILASVDAAENDSAWQSANLANVIRFMLHRIKAILNGQSQLSVFTDLLYTGVVSVDASQQPIFDEVLTEVRFNEPWRNVIRHIETEKRPVSEIKNEILGVTGNESGLFDNLNQLKMLGLLLGSDDEDYIVSEHQLRDAEETAKLNTEKFRETLELAYTKNQINETEKETLAGIVRQNEAKYFEIGDFACWRRFLEGLELQIEEYATRRQENLRIELNARKNQKSESTLLDKAAELLEKDRNFAVTEEYINRFDNGETALSDELDANIIDTDYFSRFISPDVFNPLFDQCKNRSGSTLRSYGWTFLERRLPRDWTSRQRKDSEDLVSAWPVRKDGNPPSRIQTLFSCLGMTVTNVSRASGSKEEIYKLTVMPTARSKADYLHPIAAYGTQLNSPVNVIVLYGNYPAKQLVDTITSLDLGGIPVVLIDRPVELANRRLIGQIFYAQTSRQNPFLLIDQVLLLFLAMHQITERLPALLKCTLPFSSYQPFVQDSGSIPDEMFCGRAKELARLIDPNGACVVYGGRQLGKTALLQRTESRCMDPESRRYAVYVSILKLDTESKVVEAIAAAIRKKTNDAISISPCHTVKTLCDQLGRYFRNGTITRMHLLIDEVDDFLAAIAGVKYIPIQPFVELRRETTNNFKVVLAGLHNVCRAKNATAENGIFGQFGTPLCIKPLSPTDALQLLSRPLRYLGFQIDRYPHLETILTNTNYYPGILQFFGYMLVETLSNQYTRYYQAANGNPPFTLHDEQLGAVMNSADLNRSIKDKFRWSLELDKRYFMIARCITMLYHYHEDKRHQGSWLGFPVEEIIKIARDYDIHCLAKESPNDYVVLLDEMVDMGILSKPGDGDLYRLRRSSFVDIIGDNFDSLDADIMSNNEVT